MTAPMSVRRITYISTRSPGFDNAAIADMVDKERRDNARDDITGLLVSNGLNFLQTIEGPATAVEQLLNRIKGDTRHSGIRICDDTTAHERLFANWSMEHAAAHANGAQHRETPVAWPFEGDVSATSELAQLYTGFLRLART